MADQHDPAELSPELIAALRSLGGERAPADLADGVEIALLGRVSAPPHLWTRVAGELGIGAPRGRVLAWPRWAAAAAVLLAAGIAWFGGADPLGKGRPVSYEESGLAAEVPEPLKRELIARLAVREVVAGELSPLTRAFMAGLPVPMKEGG